MDSRTFHETFHGAYTPLFEDNATCFYCGEPSTRMDHFPPLSVYVDGGPAWLIPCCEECNALLGASVQHTIEQRKAHAKEQIRKRYKKVLVMPDWSMDEIAELGFALRNHIEAATVEKRRIERRIAW